MKKVKKILVVLLLLITISLLGLASFLVISNNKIDKKIKDLDAKTNEIINKSKTSESEINSKKQSLKDLKEQYSESYKEYELWQKMNQNVLDQM